MEYGREKGFSGGQEEGTSPGKKSEGRDSGGKGFKGVVPKKEKMRSGKGRAIGHESITSVPKKSASREGQGGGVRGGTSLENLRGATINRMEI